MSERIFDVVVVGGGVSGAYAAWRLLNDDVEGNPVLGPLLAKNNGRLTVGLFEASRRIGGRLFSVTMPDAGHLPVELGGMRFLNSHRRVVGMIEHFGLEHRTLPVDDPTLTNLNYLRGQHFTVGDWKRPGFVPPYRLDGVERARAPGDLIIRVVLKYRSEATRLYGTGFWNLLYKELSAEGYALAKDAGGYWTILNNWNAGVAIPFFLTDFDPRSEYRALIKGFQSLPLALVRQFEARGGSVEFAHRLHRLDLEDGSRDGLIRLTFDSGDEGGFARHRRVRNPVVYKARHVVLAMPRRAIEMLHPDSFLFDSDQFQDDLKTVLPQPAFKIFAAYREPWWEKVRGIRAGRSVTDLPVRQCYYWGTEGEQPGADPRNRNSILMASYNDGASVEFWSGLARTPRYEPPAHPFVAGTEPVPRELRAPRDMVNELQEQIRELHGIAPGAIPEPYETIYQDWGQEPYGGGWHFWKIHANPEEVMRRIQRPLEKINLYICGEAWSTQQGWVEGALETADRVLEDELRLGPPPWPVEGGPDLRAVEERVRSVLPA